VRRVSERPEVAMRWFCLPIQHVNGCSPAEPLWWPWAPEAREKWTRDLPPEAIVEADVPGFERVKIPETAPAVFPRSQYGMVGWIVGTRAQESLNRFRSVANRRADNYIAPSGTPHVKLVRPVYDWKVEDVWAAPGKFGWDYNRAYDVMAKAGISLSMQRVAPPYGEQPMQALWMWHVCWPELWDRMIGRVAGAATAARYARTELYSFRSTAKPEGMSWPDAIQQALDRHEPEIRAQTASWIKAVIKKHRNLSMGMDMPETGRHPKSGASWELLYQIAVRGDQKRRMTNRLGPVAGKNRVALQKRRAAATASPSPASSGSTPPR